MESADATGALFSLGCFWFFYIGIFVLYIAGMWKVYTKAGKPGWAAIIPIYNFVVLMEIAGRPGWWVLLLFVPLVNIVVLAMVSIDVAASFGKSTAFGIGLWLLGFDLLHDPRFRLRAVCGPGSGPGCASGRRAAVLARAQSRRGNAPRRPARQTPVPLAGPVSCCLGITRSPAFWRVFRLMQCPRSAEFAPCTTPPVRWAGAFALFRQAE